MPPTASASLAAPSLALLATEPLRAAYEYARTRLGSRRAHRPGDGHPVVVFPGLATDERFVEPLRAHCERLGYRAIGWGRGFNTGPKGEVEAWLRELAFDVAALAGRGRVSLVGWSLGGIYAREVAKLIPRKVRRVITIGSPFAGSPEATRAGWLFRLLNPEAPPLDDGLARRLREAPPVPTTSIYSRKDGVVPWQACRDERAAHVENVEVESSHLGLVWHPDVLALVAERLRSRRAIRRPRAARRRQAGAGRGS